MFHALTYAGDARELATLVEVPRPDAGEPRRVPLLLGADAFGAPYEVLDVELTLGERVNDAGELVEFTRSTVHLGPASTETRRGNRARYLAQRAEQADQALEHARVRAYWRPDLYPPVPTAKARDAAGRQHRAALATARVLEHAAAYAAKAAA